MALKELSTNEKLDAVLRYLNNEYDAAKNSNTINVTTFKLMRDISLGVSFGEGAQHIDELELILEYLTDVEHYISMVRDGGFDQQKMYRILYSGKTFIEAGGYTEKKRILIERQLWKRQIAEKGVENSTVLNSLTRGLTCAGWAAAGGTAFLGLMELIKMLGNHCP